MPYSSELEFSAIRSLIYFDLLGKSGPSAVFNEVYCNWNLIIILKNDKYVLKS